MVQTFKDGRTSINDGDRCGKPLRSTTPENSKFSSLFLQFVGKLSTIFVKQYGCHNGPFNVLWQKI